MNPLKKSLLINIAIGGLFTLALLFLASSQSQPPQTNEKLALHNAQIIGNQLERQLAHTKESLLSISYNAFWQTSNPQDWGQWLNSQKALYQSAGISMMGVHSVSTDILWVEKASRPGKFQQLSQPLTQLYEKKEVISVLQEYKDTVAIIALTPIKNIQNEIIGALIAIQNLDRPQLSYYHELSQVPVAITSNGEIKASSRDNLSNSTQYKLVSVNWPQEINSSLWQLSLLVMPAGFSVFKIVALLLGLLLTGVLVYFGWQIAKSDQDNLLKLKNSLNVRLAHSERVAQLTELQNTSHQQDFVDAIHAVRMLLEQSIQQKKAAVIEIQKLKDKQKQLQNQASSLSNERDSAIAAPRQKSEFLSRMGDEITTPMKSVISMLKLLSEYQLDTEAMQILNIAKRSTRTLVDNLNNILDFSKLDAKMLNLSPRRFSVRELVDDLSSEHAHFAKEKKLSLQASCDPDLPSEIVADKNRIRQILRNLLSNAIRFTKSGEVKVYADIIKPGGHELLRITVTDTGVGIPAEAQKGLFDSLEQTTKLTNSSFAGRLRLIVSKNLAELMGGEIGVISETGKGSQFWFTIKID